jgi:dynein heavy chain
MEAVCILLSYKPDWNTAKQMMGEMNFLKRLQEYDANHIPEAIIKKLKPYVDHKDFQPAVSTLFLLTVALPSTIDSFRFF